MRMPLLHGEKASRRPRQAHRVWEDQRASPLRREEARICVFEDCGSLGIIGLQSIDKVGIGLHDPLDLMNPAQHQLGEGILV